LELITRSVDGAFRDAVKFLEQVSFHKGKITADIVRARTSLSDASVVENFFDHIEKKDKNGALAVITTLVDDGKDIKTFLTACLQKLHADFIGGNSEAKDLIRRFTEAYGFMKISPIAELPLEVAVVEYCGEQKIQEKKEEVKIEKNISLGLLTQEKLAEHWLDVIAAIKPYNNSIAGVLRSARPAGVKDGIVTVEAFYQFHKDKLSEVKTKQIIGDVLKKLFGEQIQVEIILGRR